MESTGKILALVDVDPNAARGLVMKSVVTILCVSLLPFMASCSSNRYAEDNKGADIVSIYQSQADQIKDLGDGWFEVVGKAVIQNITPEQAEEQAIFNACRDAIQYFSGVEISERTLDLQAATGGRVVLDHFSSLSKQTTTGIILKKNVIRKEIKTDGKNLVQIVVLRVKVGKQKGTKDPYFNVTASLNRHTFREGEELELTVQSSKDCYITVLNICSDDSVYLLFPNQYRSNNFVRAGELFRLPNEDDKRLGLSFPSKLLEGKDKDVEMIKILATKQDIALSASQPLSAYGTYELALRKLLDWIMQIPRSEIEEIDMQYIIVKN